MGRDVGVIGLGAWQLGADWGEVSEADAHATLQAAVDAGVTFIDTADVYGDGRSEQIIGSFVKDKPQLTVATKMGRRVPQSPEAYTLDNFRAWTDRSRANLGVDTLDLVQLHCPPTPVFSTDAVYDALDTLVAGEADPRVRRERREGRRGARRDRPPRHRERADHPQRVPAQAAGAGAAGRGRGRRRHHRPGAAGQRPALRPVRRAHHVRRPTTTAPTTGTARPSTSARRSPASTSQVGLEAVRRLRPLVPAGATMAQFALRWIIDQPGVTVVIPGARNPEQARANAAAAGLAPLPAETLEAVAAVYDELIRPQVHDRW